MPSVSHLRLTFVSTSPTMPRSNVSLHTPQTLDEEDEEEEETNFSSRASIVTTSSPVATRRPYSARTSEVDLRSRRPSRIVLSEYSSLLANPDGIQRSYTSEPNTARPQLPERRSTAGTIRLPRNHSRASSWGVRLATALSSEGASGDEGLAESKASLFTDERVWYDQFTSTDWVHDSIADAFRVRDLRARKDLRGRIYAWFDGAQGWVLVALIGFITALIAYFVNVMETSVFDIKEGHCQGSWYFSKRKCCYGDDNCPLWRTWGDQMKVTRVEEMWIDFIAYVFFVVLLSVGACLLTLTTKTVIPSTFSLSTLDENLGAESQKPFNEGNRSRTDDAVSPARKPEAAPKSSSMVYYPAAGSGVAEVKVILSGFVVHGYLGVKTLIVKTLALVLSVASGLSLGKEGPYVHIATCVGNIACRIFPKYNHNDGKRREVLSASAASGVGVAFGAPIGGVLFSLEEVRYVYWNCIILLNFFFDQAQLLFSSQDPFQDVLLLHSESDQNLTPNDPNALAGRGLVPQVPEPLWHKQNCHLRSPLLFRLEILRDICVHISRCTWGSYWCTFHQSI